MATLKPLKRNENLVPLSREHHFGLLFCWKIRQGLAKEVEADSIRKYVSYFWKEHLQKHFRKEEDILLPMLSPGDLKRQQLEQEHTEIRKAVKRVEEASGKDTEDLQALEALVNVHIRFEERELFPYLEKKATESQLQEIGKLLAKDKEPAEDTYQPEFWV